MMSFISSSSPSRLKGQIKTFLVIYTLTNVFDMYTQSLLDMSNVVMDNPILSSGKKIPHPIWTWQLNIRVAKQKGHMWLYLHFTHIGQLIGPPPKTCHSKPPKNPTCLEYGFYICYFGPHDSGQHPKPLHTFHLHKLPRSGSQIP